MRSKPQSVGRHWQWKIIGQHMQSGKQMSFKTKEEHDAYHSKYRLENLTKVQHQERVRKVKERKRVKVARLYWEIRLQHGAGPESHVAGFSESVMDKGRKQAQDHFNKLNNITQT